MTLSTRLADQKQYKLKSDFAPCGYATAKLIMIFSITANVINREYAELKIKIKIKIKGQGENWLSYIFWTEIIIGRGRIQVISATLGKESKYCFVISLNTSKGVL
jgi:hypothetical protein